MAKEHIGDGGGHGPAAAPAARFARNAEQLARAFGLNLSPRKRKGSLAIVSEWLASPDFPKKNPPSKGWRLEEVTKWLEARSPESTVQSPKSGQGGETPALPVGVGPVGDLFEEAGNGYERTLDQWEDKLKHPDKWLMAPIQKWQIEELKRKRPGLFGEVRAATADETAAADEGGATGTVAVPEGRGSPLPDCESQKALAIRLAQHFRGRMTIDLSEQQISKWKLGEGLPPGSTLPPPKLGNRFETQAWADWIERFILPRHGVKTDPQGRLEPSIFERASEAKAQREIDEAAVARMDLDILRGKYIEVAVVERLVAGLARKYHEFWKARNEKQEIEFMRAELKSLGVAEEQSVKLCERLADRARDFLALVESRCEEMGREFSAMDGTTGMGKHE